MWSGALSLHSGGVPLPLVGVVVQVTMLEFIAHVVIQQKYRNPAKEAVEAIYTFPLDSRSVLRSFNVEMAGRTLDSQLEEREQAKVSYEEALESGQAAALLVQDSSMQDVFTLRLGNLPPNASAAVTLDYVTQVDEEPQDDGSVKLRFVLPTAVAPRYQPHGYHGHHGFSQASQPSSPPVDPESPSAGAPGHPADDNRPSPSSSEGDLVLTVTGNITSASKVLSIEALTLSSFANTSVDEKGTGRFRVVSPALDQDLVVAVHLQDRLQDRAWLDESGAVLVSTGLGAQVETGRQEDEEEQQQPGEFIFVIDRSGSMWGESIRQARQVLSLCISSLPPGSLFNVIGFGSDFTSLFPEPRAYDDESKRVALEHCRDIEADMGGTEILQPLLFLAKTAGAGKRGGRRVMLLTDGQVMNTDEVVSAVRGDHGRSGTRYLSIGIGAAVSRDLVVRVAAAGEGSAEFVVEGERMHSKAMQQMRRALEPGLREVHVVDYGPWKVLGQPSPRAPRPLYSGTRQLSYALLDPNTTINSAGGVVTVQARRPDGTPLSWTVPVSHSPWQGVIRPLAARSMLQELEEEEAAADNSSSHQAERLREDAIALSLVTGVPCRWTSFVAVDRAADPLLPPSAERPRPVTIPLGVLSPPQAGAWVGGGAVPLAFSTMASATMMTAAGGGGGGPRARMAFAPAGGLSMDKAASTAAPGLPPQQQQQQEAGVAYMTASFAAADVERTLQAEEEQQEEEDHVSLLAWQLASGAWQLNDALIKATGAEADQVRSFEAANRLDGGGGDDEQQPEEVWATALALALLDAKWKTFEDEWSAGADKAWRWLKRQVGGKDEAERRVELARSLLELAAAAEEEGAAFSAW